MRSFHRANLKIVTCFVGVIFSSAALAQAPRSSIDTPASKGLPEFRDPKTGQVWTPANVGGVSGPNTPADRAFDPLAQTAVVQGMVIQRPQITQVGTSVTGSLGGTSLGGEAADLDARVAIAQCQDGAYASAIPVLQQQLRDARVAVPSP